MTTIIIGNGNMGRAIASAMRDRGDGPAVVLGRPETGAHPADLLVDTELAFEASLGPAVAANVDSVIAAGCRRVVIATTGWQADRGHVERALLEHGAAAVVGSNFSLGVVGFMRVAAFAGDLFARLGEFDPYVVEHHRASKADRPSGTAREIARRLLAADPRKERIVTDPAGPLRSSDLEVVSVRAGVSPGSHLVGFDGPGDSIELRISARDRTGYAAGALLAADWLRGAPRSPGIHEFDEVVDDALRGRSKPGAVVAG